MKNDILVDDIEYIFKNINNKLFFRDKKILITGASGFIGFYLSTFFISYFKELKISKLYLVDLKIKKRKNLNKNIIIIKSDILKLQIEKINLDVIIHAASIASPVFYRKFPLQTCDVNVDGLKKILDYAKNKKKISILYFSSSEIYGDPNKKNIPTKESYRGNVSCVGPRACYDEAKRYCETLSYIYATYYGVSVKVVRPFNNYGPGLNLTDGRAPADFANSIKNDKDIEIFSNGKAKRSFCYISDACIGYINTISLNKYTILNIGNPKEISILELANIYKSLGKKIFRYKKKIKFKKNKDKNYNTDSPNRRCPDIQKAKLKIKFNPKISILEGVERYLRYQNIK